MTIKTKPKVSVIIPLYNQKQFVGQAIESILNQSYENIEIIVVNDGSTDNPFSVLEKYKDNIILINQENKGLAGARNTGIKNSSGEYLQLLDADDFLHEDKIKLQLEFLKNHNAIISYCEALQYSENNKKTYPNYIGKVEDMFSSLYNIWEKYPLPSHSLLIKREIFDRFGLFDEQLKASEDRYFFSKLAAKKIDFKYYPFYGCFRRLHKYQMTKNNLKMIEYLIKYYKKLNEDMGNDFFIDKYGYTGFQMMCANLTYLYRSNVYTDVKRKELKSIKRLLKKNKIKFEAKPIPLNYKRFKLKRFILSAYLRRWLKKIFTGKILKALETMKNS